MLAIQEPPNVNKSAPTQAREGRNGLQNVLLLPTMLRKTGSWATAKDVSQQKLPHFIIMTMTVC